jgi:hypothetical protein
MNQPINRTMHGVADYTYAPLVALAPNLAGFEDEKTAATICHVLSAGLLGSTLFTRAEWAPFKLIPFKAHLMADVAAGLLSLGAPWLFGFAKNVRARNIFLAIGLTNLAAGLLTKPEEMPETQVS